MLRRKLYSLAAFASLVGANFVLAQAPPMLPELPETVVEAPPVTEPQFNVGEPTQPFPTNQGPQVAQQIDRIGRGTDLTGETASASQAFSANVILKVARSCGRRRFWKSFPALLPRSTAAAARRINTSCAA